MPSKREIKREQKKEKKILKQKASAEKSQALANKFSSVSNESKNRIRKIKTADPRAIKKSSENTDNLKRVKISEANKISKALNSADENYDKASNFLVGVFKKEHYPNPPEPDFEDILVFTDDDGEVKGMSVLPKKKEGTNNGFIYFDTPRVKAIYARVILASILMMVLLLFISTKQYVPGIIGAIVLLSLISILLGMRQASLGIFGYPITLPAWMMMTTVDEYADEIEDDIEYDDDGEEKEVTVHTRTKPIGDVLSPGIYLSQWLTHYNISKKVFAQKCGLELSTVTRLVNDEEKLWSDDDILAKISEVTNASSDRWKEALKDWKSAKEEKSSS